MLASTYASRNDEFEKRRPAWQHGLQLLVAGFRLAKVTTEHQVGNLQKG